MAGDTCAAKMTESASKEIAMNGKESPAENHCCKDGVSKGLDNSCLPYADIPVIDVGLLVSPSSASGREELGKLRSAFSSYGCFWAINHGMTSSFLEKVQLVMKQFSELPMDEKQKYAMRPGGPEGYGNDVVARNENTYPISSNFKRLVLAITPEDQRQRTFWPQNPANFRETFLEFTNMVSSITEVLFKAMALSLNIEEHCFLDQYGAQPTVRARATFYPPHSKDVRAHTDPTALTFLIQDKEGLEILKDDQWFKVSVNPEAIFVNTGEQLEVMSNGIFKSLLHRVVTNPDGERISLAVFCYPDPDCVIEPVDALVNQTKARSYKKVKNYLNASLQNYKQLGSGLLDTLKV